MYNDRIDESYDVLIVGAGPVGSIAAEHAVKHGARVLMIEEHASIGSPVGCTGLLSKRAMEECEVDLAHACVLNSVRGAFVHAMDGTCLPIDGRETKAFVVSRKIFDRTLASRAVQEGAELWLRTRAIGIGTQGDHRILHAMKDGEAVQIKAKVIIGADGVRSNIARMAGLGRVKKVLPGIQIEMPYRCMDTDFVELYTGSQAPGFFAWAVPVNEHIARIGLALDGGDDACAIDYLQRLVRDNAHIASRCGEGSIDLVAGAIPLGPQKRTYAEGVLIVGDAAGQVKPTSGGGIYTGAVCAKIAGEVAARAALDGDSSASRLAEYDRRWRAKLSKELAIGMKVHDFIKGLNDQEINELISSMDQPPILDTITRYGDMDHPSILIKQMLKPSNTRYLLGVFRAFVKAVL